jgi:AAT family amino acid transporter
MIITHMTYRKKTPENELPTFKMPLYPLSDVAVLTFFLAMIIILLIFPNYRIPMISAGIIFVVLVCITHFIQKKMN